MRMIKPRSRIIAGLLLFALLASFCPIAASADIPVSYPGCGMVWKDTCIPFERNNETAYNEEIMALTAPIAANITEPLPDYRNLSWSSAFLAFHTLIKERYAYTAWRSVDWDSLYTSWAPEIADAEKREDKAAYYRALRGYLHAIPDGHVSVFAAEGDFGARYADIGGSYGFAVTRLDSGEVIISYVANGSAAERAGIRFGDEVSMWNGRPVMEAITTTPYIWAVKKPSTSEGILLQQSRLLTRAPVGTHAEVTVIQETTPLTVDLTAYDDGAETVKKTTFFLGKEINDIGAANMLTDIQPQVSNDLVTYRTLPDGYAYIAIYKESYEEYQPFRAAMLSAIANQSPGMVIDLRYNSGGDDNIASCFAGWFVDEPVFYEYTTQYDPGLKTFRIVSEAWTQPQPTRFNGPVAVLVSPDTISSGEGLPMVFAKTGTGRIISWYGTNGAFGMNGPRAIMPLGMYMFFPDGASLDQNRVIQVDSNASLTGGIAPHIRVPLNENTVARAMAGEDVQLTYALQWLDEQQPAAAIPPDLNTPAQSSSPGIALVLFGLCLFIVIAKRK